MAVVQDDQMLTSFSSLVAINVRNSATIYLTAIGDLSYASLDHPLLFFQKTLQAYDIYGVRMEQLFNP